MVIYTPGTTGEPKGALISNANVMQLAQMSTEEFKVTPADSVYPTFLCHIAEKIFTLFIPLTSGAVTHLVSRSKPYNLTSQSHYCLSWRSENLGRMHSRINLKMKDALAQAVTLSVGLVGR